MSLSILDPSHGGYKPTAQQISLDVSPSSSTSSQDSIFSHASSQSSLATQSSASDKPQCLPSQALHNSFTQQSGYFRQDSCAPAIYQHASVSAEQRQHPRRTSSDGASKPPALVRQDERKALFVNDLVDSATNLVEVIWPTSSSPSCRNSREVLPLRRYIEETLRRSRTSYSTLQVALYYLILIKSHVPRGSLTMDQCSPASDVRALQCGRRMFLAALILASKYLQDRNYSAKAWSKMSGLPIGELNTNERTFLLAVNWKLHIPDCIFRRWTDVVLRYTTPQEPPPPGQSSSVSDNKLAWRRIVPLLTPDLDDISSLSVGDTSFAPTKIPIRARTLPTSSTVSTSPRMTCPSPETTPTPATVLPRFLEPTPKVLPPTPALSRMGPLPTPQMTPTSIASSTPAASVYGSESRRSSMSLAIGHAQSFALCRSTTDQYPGAGIGLDRYITSRRPSLVSASSSGSSPESMVSDLSRSSRSSSISSVSASSTCAPSQACLARLATCRSARLPVPSGCAARSAKDMSSEHVLIMDDADLLASPDMANFSIQDASPTPVPTTQPASAATHYFGARVRSRPRPRACPSYDASTQEWNVRGTVRKQESCDAIERVDSPMSVSVKAMQPPALLRSDGSSGRIPLEKDLGRKRRCCSAQVAVGAAEEDV